MRQVRLLIEYDGTNYAGWQRQATTTLTVQQCLEQALERMVHHPVTLRGAGRTDAGVHARGQVACFATETTIPCQGFVRGLNSALPRSISVREAEDVAPEFDARRWAIGKRYIYRIWNRATRSALLDRMAWHVHTPIDHQAMHAAAQALLGEHDFTSFRAAGCDAKHPVRRMSRAEVERQGDMVVFTLEGTAFLKNMVRIITGTLEEVGRGKRADLASALVARDREAAGKTAPPKGLVLDEIFYGEGRPAHLRPDA